jgi:hypothetical protein
LSDKFAPKLAVKRWQAYLKEEEKERKRRRSYSNKNQKHIIAAAILWLLELITNILEKIHIKTKRIVEKVAVE